MKRWIPNSLVTNHRIKDGQELAHASGESELFGFTCTEQALVEGSDDRIASRCGDRCHVKDTAQIGSATPTSTLAPHRSGVAVKGSYSHQSSQLSALERSEFRKARAQGKD